MAIHIKFMDDNGDWNGIYASVGIIEDGDFEIGIPGLTAIQIKEKDMIEMARWATETQAYPYNPTSKS